MIGLVAACGRIGFDGTSGVAGDGSTGDDASTGDAGPATYSDLTDPTKWSAFDTTSVNPGAWGFVGATFDGRYLYLVPSYSNDVHGIVLRYDTRAAFSSVAAWTAFDISTIDAKLRGFNGAAFDGRYLYLVPHEHTVGTLSGVVARYDTQADFTAPGSWSTFNVATVAAQAVGFFGAAFDGRYLYLSSYSYTTMARYDTTQAFTASAAWTTFDVATVAAAAPAFTGATFDGRYVYFSPFIGNAASGLTLRYDTQGAFASPTAWTAFDISSVVPLGQGFGNIAFDGRYVHYPPFFNTVAARYDTQGAFTDGAAWSSADLGASVRYLGGAFDGKHVYFVPYPEGTIARIDVEGAYAGAAFTTFDQTTLDPNAKSFYGAAFDGQYLYVIPHGSRVITRFEARTPPALPSLPSFSGSFL